MSDLFRKSSLEKLSSPEQLDKMIVITPPSFWLAMVGAALIVVATIVWSIFGRLPENVETQGIYINRAGIHSVYSEGSGVVKELKVQDGDTVKKGDIIALLDTSNVDEKIAEYEEKKSAVENVSTNTNVNAVKISNDTNVLAEYQSLYQSVVTLDYQTRQLTTKRGELSLVETQYKDAESAYYGALNTGDSTKEQMALQEAQNTYSAVIGSAEYVQAEQDFTSANATLESAKKTLEEAQQATKDAEAAYNAALEAAEGDTTATDVVASKEVWDNAKAAEEVKATDVSTAESVFEAAKAIYQPYKDVIDSYEKTKKAYLDKIASITNAQAKVSELQNKYSVVAQQYNNEKSIVENLEDSIEQTKLQIDTYKTNILRSLESEHKQYIDRKKASEIKASADGRVSDLAVSEGSVIGQGSEVAKIQKGEDSDRVVVCYVPVSNGRKITTGMKVLIYPSTVNKQEYGHMEATVVKVDDYITSTTDMQRQLGNNNLVEAFMQNGPVVEVRCELKTDPSTVSGYYWSSNKGASVNVDGGTMVEASVIISEKPPISMLIPFLKEKLTIKAEN